MKKAEAAQLIPEICWDYISKSPCTATRNAQSEQQKQRLADTSLHAHPTDGCSCTPTPWLFLHAHPMVVPALQGNTALQSPPDATQEYEKHKESTGRTRTNPFSSHKTKPMHPKSEIA